MNTNWSKILLFSLLFGVLGFIVGRMCGSCHHGGCGPEGMGMMKHDEACGHGEAGMAGKEGKGTCCMDGHHGMAGDTVSVVTNGKDTMHVQITH